jgi:purine-binding chemotaxis protein CheW
MSDALTKDEKMEAQIYGSFFLSDSEFALSATYVQEVVNAPAAYTPMPLAPSYLKGLLNLRGVVIPVLDLRELLRLQNGARPDTQKIAIVELDGSCVGLIFDKTGEVFRDNQDERCDFDRDDLTTVVSGVFKKDSGNRIVQILDVTKIFKVQNLPKDSRQNRIGREGLGKKRGNRKQCISFVVGPAKCSLPISDIQEILLITKLNDSTIMDTRCIGTIDIRGTTVPVVDFAELLNYRKVNSETAMQGERRIIVMKLENEFFGLMVDSVDSIVSYFPDELLTFPLIEQSRAEMFLGCITGHSEGDILLLDCKKILSNTEISKITHGHSKLFHQNEQRMAEKKTKNGTRRTYITFSLDNLYAVAINEVKEIIEYPKQLLHPPGLKKHIRGVLNLRGDLVTIVDVRSMYLISKSDQTQEIQKVMVFKRNEAHFGLVVDSVESIVTFSEDDKIKLPEMLYDKSVGSISEDISEAVEVTDSSGVKRSMLILSMESVVNRASQ